MTLQFQVQVQYQSVVGGVGIVVNVQIFRGAGVKCGSVSLKQRYTLCL